MARPAAGPRRRAEQKDATRARIVAAALTLFRLRGFDATTTKAIARKARVAEGTVFNYFPTKEDIALFFLAQEVELAIDAVQKNTRLRKAPIEEKLFTLVKTQLEFLARAERFTGCGI